MPKYEHLVLRFSPGYTMSSAPNGQLHKPNADALLEEMQGTLNQKQTEGWAVVSATDVLEGHWALACDAGYGYSTTAAIVVILRRELPA
jgi:hypothetical protein